MASKANLDALIIREDFEAEDESNLPQGQQKSTVSINDLKRGEFFFSGLRKPDFQRETSEWEPDKISGFIESFVNGDLIPAIILWKSPNGFNFTVDGAHRLSALAAWINDDYGDGEISREFYEGMIPKDQKEVAQKTRGLIAKNIGTFYDYQRATLENNEDIDPEILSKARNLGTLSISLQWIVGNASKAEDSFFKINQKATPIDPTEKKVLKARKQPNGIATRAILRGGKGHKYWAAFSEDNQRKIEKLAREINTILFQPELDTPIKTLDLPIAGKVFSAQTLPLILDFVNIVNNLTKSVAEDRDGTETINYLKNCKRVAQRINSNHPGSLGLHPIAYFYSVNNGRHKPASFYAITALIMELEKANSFDKFTAVRKDFEKLIVDYDYVIQQIVRQFRGALKSYTHIQHFYLLCQEKLYRHKSIKQAITEIAKKEPDFDYLKLDSIDDPHAGADFSSEAKSEVFIRETIQSANRCKICSGLLHKNSMSVDHIKRKREGGRGSAKNAQLAHLYCNTTYKK
jgi:hypothetical protein